MVDKGPRHEAPAMDSIDQKVLAEINEENDQARQKWSKAIIEALKEDMTTNGISSPDEYFSMEKPYRIRASERIANKALAIAIKEKTTGDMDERQKNKFRKIVGNLIIGIDSIPTEGNQEQLQ